MPAFAPSLKRVRIDPGCGCCFCPCIYGGGKCLGRVCMPEKLCFQWIIPESEESCSVTPGGKFDVPVNLVWNGSPGHLRWAGTAYDPAHPGDPAYAMTVFLYCANEAFPDYWAVSVEGPGFGFSGYISYSNVFECDPLNILFDSFSDGTGFLSCGFDLIGARITEGACTPKYACLDGICVLVAPGTEHLYEGTIYENDMACGGLCA